MWDIRLLGEEAVENVLNAMEIRSHRSEPFYLR